MADDGAHNALAFVGKKFLGSFSRANGSLRSSHADTSVAPVVRTLSCGERGSVVAGSVRAADGSLDDDESQPVSAASKSSTIVAPTRMSLTLRAKTALIADVSLNVRNLGTWNVA